jgi:hypothetical protein
MAGTLECLVDGHLGRPRRSRVGPERRATAPLVVLFGHTLGQRGAGPM